MGGGVLSVTNWYLLFEIVIENGDGSRNLAAYQDEKFDDTYGNTKPLKLHNDKNLSTNIFFRQFFS